jgi:hypothetical protein
MGWEWSWYVFIARQWAESFVVHVRKANRSHDRAAPLHPHTSNRLHTSRLLLPSRPTAQESRRIGNGSRIQQIQKLTLRMLPIC